MKKVIVVGLISLSLSQSAHADFYYYLYYNAQPTRLNHQNIFQKRIAHYKGDNWGKGQDLIQDDYFAFIKKNHPEYYQAYLAGNRDDEFHIHSQARVEGGFPKESDAQNALDKQIKDVRQNYKEIEVIVVDDYVYSGK